MLKREIIWIENYFRSLDLKRLNIILKNYKEEQEIIEKVIQEKIGE